MILMSNNSRNETVPEVLERESVLINRILNDIEESQKNDVMEASTKHAKARGTVHSKSGGSNHSKTYSHAKR